MTKNHSSKVSKQKTSKGSSISMLLAQTAATTSTYDAYCGFSKPELINLTIQLLNDLGLQKSSQTLQEEAAQLYGPKNSSPLAFKGKLSGRSVLESFLNQIKEGEFDKAEKLVDKLDLKSGQNINPKVNCAFSDLGWVNDHPNELNPISSTPNNNEQSIKNQVIFLIRKQKFLEFLLLGKSSKAALNILKTEISPLSYSPPNEINMLSSLIVDDASNVAYIQANGFETNRSNSQSAQEKSRNSLIAKISDYIVPHLLLPPHRLLTLLTQAQNYQKSMNLITLDDDPLNNDQCSLYEDYIYPADKFPCKILQSIRHPGKQIWFVRFDPTGKYLAVVPNDSKILIYSVGEFGYNDGIKSPDNNMQFKLHGMLTGHGKEVLYCSWSNDGTKLLSGGYDGQVRLWDVESGKCLQKTHVLLSKNDSPSAKEPSSVAPSIKAVEWLPNGDGFIVGSPEKELVYFSSDGEEKYRWSGIRILDLAVTCDSKYVVAISRSNLYVFDLINNRKIRDIHIGIKLTTVDLSRKNQHQAIIHVMPDTIQIWDWKLGIHLKKFTGQKQEEFIVRSTMDPSERVLVSGSEDGRVYMWNTKFSALVLAIKGHRKLINAVDYHPKYPWMFVTGSDDETVKVWGPNAALRIIQETKITILNDTGAFSLTCDDENVDHAVEIENDLDKEKNGNGLRTNNRGSRGSSHPLVADDDDDDDGDDDFGEYNDVIDDDEEEVEEDDDDEDNDDDDYDDDDDDDEEQEDDDMVE